MTFGAKPMGPPPLRPRPPSRGDTAFAVGSRALITPAGTSSTSTGVQLLDEDGMPTSRHLPADATVVITAWRPRRSAPPRYRVCTSDQIEGWVDAANLRRLPPPPPPAPMIASAPPKPVVTKASPPKTPKPAAKSAPVKPVAKAPAKVAPPAKIAPPAKVAAPIAARKAARPAAARARQAPPKPAAKPKRSRPTSKRAR